MIDYIQDFHTEEVPALEASDSEVLRRLPLSCLLGRLAICTGLLATDPGKIPEVAYAPPLPASQFPPES